MKPSTSSLALLSTVITVSVLHRFFSSRPNCLDEDVQLVGALVLGPDDPPVVPLAVLQAGEDHLIGLGDGGHCWWRLERACRLKQCSPMSWLVSSLGYTVGTFFH
jgi:hypothetical protein